MLCGPHNSICTARDTIVFLDQIWLKDTYASATGPEPLVHTDVLGMHAHHSSRMRRHECRARTPIARGSGKKENICDRHHPIEEMRREVVLFKQAMRLYLCVRCRNVHSKARHSGIVLSTDRSDLYILIVASISKSPLYLWSAYGRLAHINLPSRRDANETFTTQMRTLHHRPHQPRMRLSTPYDPPTNASAMHANTPHIMQKALELEGLRRGRSHRQSPCSSFDNEGAVMNGHTHSYARARAQGNLAGERAELVGFTGPSTPFVRSARWPRASHTVTVFTAKRVSSDGAAAAERRPAGYPHPTSSHRTTGATLRLDGRCQRRVVGACRQARAASRTSNVLTHRSESISSSSRTPARVLL